VSLFKRENGRGMASNEHKMCKIILNVISESTAISHTNIISPEVNMECNENDNVLSFVAEWFDPHSQLLKTYLLTAHVKSEEGEMNDTKTRRKFLKRSPLPPTLGRSDFVKGSIIVLFSRKLKLVDYADKATSQLLEVKEERMTILVTPTLNESIGDIVMSVEREDFALVDVKSLHFASSSIDDINEAMQLLPGMELRDLCSSSRSFVALSFRGSDAIASVRKLVESSPFCKGVVCPREGEEMEFSDFFLDKHRSTTATLEDCTACVIRPHIIKQHMFGQVFNDVIARGFIITAMQMIRLDKETAAEFLEVYKGVFPQYVELVDEMSSGSLIALEVKKHAEGRTGDIVEDFRAHAGPWDYTVACELHPQSIRAKFGRSSVANAIHCTDLPKDGVLECEYFFKVLAGR
jgi:nucleoside-diphosphate kinase